MNRLVTVMRHGESFGTWSETARRMVLRAKFGTACALLGTALACGAMPFVTGAAHAEDDGIEPFLVFDRSHPLLPAGETPMVQVYDTGRVVVTRGPGHTRPGRFEFRLDATMLGQVRALVANGALARVTGVAPAPRREVVDGREVFTVVHDAVTTSMRVRVGGGSAAQSLAGAPATVRVIEVEDLAGLADAAVKSIGTRALIELERSLLEVFAQPVEGGER